MSGAIYPSLRGKRVVVTGGGSGIGAAIAQAFVGQGAQVSILDVKAGDGGPPTVDRPVFHQCDLTALSEVTRTFAAITSDGPIDILVNNAASDDRHKIDEVTPAYWDDRIAVNLRHLFFCAQAAVRGMRANRGGAIINLGSISWHLGLPNYAVYATAKAGIEGMTRALARELGPSGIRVTCVVPGSVKTPKQSQWYTPSQEAEIVAQQCLNARVEPSHVASMVLFLASDDAALCTGHAYWVDAGWR